MAPSRRHAGRLRPLLDKLFVAFEDAPWLIQVLLYLCTAPLLEALFYLHTASWREWRSSAPHNTHERADTAAVLAFYDRILAEEDADGLKSFLQGWFLEQPASPWQEPRYGNIREFVAWTLYGDAGERKPKQISTVDRVMNQIEAVLGPLPAGRAERLVAMTYTREPLGRCHRPLAVYLCCFAAHGAISRLLQLLGFNSRSVGRLRYLHRPDRRGGGASSAPLVFLHGIGGLLPYPLLLLQLASRWEGPVLLPLLPHGALDRLPTSRCVARAMRMPELVGAVEVMVRRHALNGRAPSAAFMSHSLGTGPLQLRGAAAARPALSSPCGVSRQAITPPSPLARPAWSPRPSSQTRSASCCTRGTCCTTSCTRSPPSAQQPGSTGCSGSPSPPTPPYRTACGANFGGRSTGSTPRRCLRRPPCTSPRPTPSATPAACKITSSGTARRRPGSTRRSRWS